MANRLDNLFLSFKAKGFIPIEIPGLIQDVFNIIGKGRYSNITYANQELEELGWGIGIMDNDSYKLMNSLVQ